MYISIVASKLGAESPVSVIDSGSALIADCNYRPIVVNIAQDSDNLYIVLYKIGYKSKKKGLVKEFQCFAD